MPDLKKTADSAAVINNNGEVIETSMDDIELDNVSKMDRIQ